MYRTAEAGDKSKIKELLGKAIKTNEMIKNGLSNSLLLDLVEEDVSQAEPNLYNHSFSIEFPRSRKYIQISILVLVYHCLRVIFINNLLNKLCDFILYLMCSFRYQISVLISNNI